VPLKEALNKAILAFSARAALLHRPA